jgi:general secretion pathway protein G
MIDRLKQKRNEQGGFTLIELLIVVIVLAILAAIVVFALGTTRSDSVHSACSTSEKSVELSAEAANTHYGSYPPASADATGGANLVVGAKDVNGNIYGGLLKTYPTSNDYSLVYATGANNTYTVSVYKGTTIDAAHLMGTGQTACTNNAL